MVYLVKKKKERNVDMETLNKDLTIRGAGYYRGVD